MQGKKQSSRLLRLLLAVLLALVIQVVGILWWFSSSQAATQQPVAFDHEAMVKVGITCLFCHADATRSPAAGMPSVESCMGCHEVIATDKPAIQTVADYWQRGEPIPWVRVNRLPRFVYFSHRVHVVAAGLNCERCHGDVAHMKMAEPVVEMNMGWCLGCHNQQPNSAQLRDCVVCHQ
jgi:c(7)-type cytochrome triheme protein